MDNYQEDYTDLRVENCKECDFPLKVYNQVHEGGKVEEIAYCRSCGMTETLMR